MLLIKNAYIKTMAGEDIASGSILIDDGGKIAAIGEDICAPADCETIDAEGRLVTPGCVEAHAHIGLGVAGDPSDTNPTQAGSTTPQLRAIDAICPTNENFYLGLSGGVTTACIGPGSANAIGGTFAAIKLYGECIDDMVIKDPVAMKCAFGENVKSTNSGHGRLGKTRMGIAADIRELLFKSLEYLNAKEAGKNPSFDMKLEAMIPVLKREIPLKAHAHRADDIFTSIRIAKEFNLRLTLDHCSDGCLIADILATEGFPAVVGPSFGAPSKIELAHNSYKNVPALYNAGVSICITTDASIVPLDKLPMCAGYAVREGLPHDVAWRAITIYPAEIMGIADKVGSLEVGKDGDLVIWESDPISNICSSALLTIVDGKVVYKR